MTSKETLTRKITEHAIRAARKNGIWRVYDSSISGFFCQFNKDETITLYFRYRSKLTKGRPVLKLGNWPALSADDARGVVQGWVADLSNGIEPKIKRQQLQEEQRLQEASQRHQELQIFGRFIELRYGPHLLRNKLGKEDVQRLKRHFSHWNRRPIGELTKGDVTRWQHKWERAGLAHATIARSYAVLQGLLNHAVEVEVVSANPLKGVSLLRPPAADVDDQEEGERRALERHEVKCLFRGLEIYTAEKKEARRRSRLKKSNRHLPDLTNLTYVDHVVPAILCIYYGGFRPGDVFGLQWPQIDHDMRSIRKVVEKIAHHGKGKMHFKLSRSLSNVLRTWWNEQGKPSTGYVFPSPRNAKDRRRLSKGALRKAWPKIKKYGGLDAGLDLYTLRHNFASQLIMAGVDLMTVSKLMGHTSIETTIKHYGHLRQQHIEEALELVEKKQGRPRISHP